MLLDRLRLIAVNLLIATILALVVIEAIPQSPPALRSAVQPVTQRLGLAQSWSLFTPPDTMNMRLRAEITYRDGQTATWRSPEWSELSPWQRFIGHRDTEWLDNVWGQEDAPIWPSWARHLARTARPDFPAADRDAEVKIIVEDSPTRSAELNPWTTWKAQPAFEEPWTLTIEKLP